VKGEAAARLLVASLPTPTADVSDRNIVIGDEAAARYIGSLRPSHDAFSVAGARKCASDYRLSGMWGAVPASCRDGTMLLTLDDIGFTLWGWPNRFLARMKDANVRVIIAQDVVDGQIKGLTDVNQYGDIANSYNGYIWVDDIEELGPALRR
jgi:glycerophosphoryl diester phosphodiesterase